MKQTEIEIVAAHRIRVLRKLHENPTPELKAEFRKLNERMLELSPRVHPDQLVALNRTLGALNRARSEMDELDKLIASVTRSFY